jgi:hypothetical protein
MQLVHHDSVSPTIIRIVYPYAGLYVYVFLLGSGFIMNERGEVNQMNEGWFTLVNSLLEDRKAEIVE